MSESRDAELFKGLLSDYPSVMRDPVPFKVVLLVANGVDNPRSIADALGVKPPTVIYQLRRLRKVKFVKLGAKEGKMQHYEVNWKGLSEAFSKVTGCFTSIEEMSKNSHFRTLLKEAFYAAGKFAVKCSPDARKVRLTSWRTSLEDFFGEFKVALIKSFPELKTRKSVDPESTAFIKRLEECNEKFKRYYGTKGDLFWRIALEKSGIAEKKFSTIFKG